MLQEGKIQDFGGFKKIVINVFTTSKVAEV